jgi:SAM-dependent methyltransferase
VDVIISNCVINLSADKARVIREAYRVLNPGGRFAVSDVVLRGNLPEPVLRSVGLWTACISGALHEDEYRRLLMAAGFSDVSIEPTRVYSNEDVQALLDSAGLEDPELVTALEGNIMSAFVRGTKLPA